MTKPIYRPSIPLERERADSRLRRLEQSKAPPGPRRLAAQDDASIGTISHRQHLAWDAPTGLITNVNPDPVSFVWSTLIVQIGPNAWQSHDGGGNIIGIALLLTTVGTSTTTAQLRKNGSVIGISASLASASTSTGPILFAASVAFGGPMTDYLQAELTAIGTGAAGLTVSALRG